MGTKISVHPAFLIFFFYIVIIFSNSVLNFVQTKKMKSTSYPFLSRFYSKPLFFLQISPISLREKKICQDRAISSNDISMRIFNQLQFIWSHNIFNVNYPSINSTLHWWCFSYLLLLDDDDYDEHVSWKLRRMNKKRVWTRELLSETPSVKSFPGYVHFLLIGILQPLLLVCCEKKFTCIWNLSYELVRVCT